MWSIRVPQLLKRLHVSERHLERGFLRALGVSPHQYIRILRFREALHLMRAGQFDRLSDVAYDLNYVDQSHFIKDTKALSGYTPGQLVTAVDAGVDLPCALIEIPRESDSAAAARRDEQAVATGNDRATRYEAVFKGNRGRSHRHR
jgi:AraC-like DNA-binding protein